MLLMYRCPARYWAFLSPCIFIQLVITEARICVKSSNLGKMLRSWINSVLKWFPEVLKSWCPILRYCISEPICAASRAMVLPLLRLARCILMVALRRSISSAVS